MSIERTDVLPTANAAVTRREVTLVVLEGPESGRRVRLDGAALSIGKDPASGLCLPDAAVSRNHCMVEKRHEGYLIRDLGSTNGTFVDGTRVREAYLRPGSRLQVGNVVLLFQPVYQADEVPPSTEDHFGDLVGQKPGHAPGVRGPGAGGAHRGHPPAHRRDRHRQGGHRPGNPRGEPPGRRIPSWWSTAAR